MVERFNRTLGDMAHTILADSGLEKRCGNPVFQPFIPKDSTNPHYQPKFRFRSSIHPRSPLTAWLNSHWIRRYSIFPLLEEQRTHGQQSRRPPKSTITQYPTFWTLLNQPFLTLLEMSHFPTNHHHDNCHPWKLPHLVSFPIMSLSHPCSCLFPHSGR